MLELSKLTLEEKIKLLSGKSGDIVAEKYGEKYLVMKDGPHGVKTHGVCYPNMCLIAGSWDKELLYKIGRSIGNDCIAEGVDVLLGPSVNIKRTPLCGRNFEYISEEPLLAGVLGASFIEGAQSKGIYACVKHFCCYNQEQNRFTQSVEVDEETMMNVYVRVFYILLKKSSPKLLMTSYNRVNGEFVSQNKHLLQDVLRKKLNYDGLVITDWGGVELRQKGLAAGVDINMPGDLDVTWKEVLTGLDEYGITEKAIDTSVQKVIDAIDGIKNSGEKYQPTDMSFLQRASAESMVLLKNEKMLPLEKRDDIVVVGDLAVNPCFQGGGCASIETEAVNTPYSELCARLDKKIPYAKGYTDNSIADQALESQALALCRKADKILFFAGLYSTCESEGFDRKNIKLPQNQIDLLKKLHLVNKNIIVILTNGAAVELKDLAGSSAAILECWYAGEMYAGALLDVLTGAVNPSGRLAETFPDSYANSSAAKTYVDGNDAVKYTDGEIIGHRHYQSKNIAPAFAFGYGLSYSRFEYLDFSLSENITDGSGFFVTVRLKNVSGVKGKEVIQIYLQKKSSSFRSLAAFEKIELSAGEEKTVKIAVDSIAFERYLIKDREYAVDAGSYIISVCRDSLTPIFELPLVVSGAFRCNRYTKIDELRKIANGPELILKYFSRCLGMAVFGEPEYIINFKGNELDIPTIYKNIAYSLPLYVFTTLTAGILSNSQLDEIIQKINSEIL